MIFNLRLQMAVLSRFLPKRVNFRFAACIDDVGEAFRFCRK